MSTSVLIKSALSVAVVGAFALSAATPVRAAPVLSNILTVKTAASTGPTYVRWRYQYPSYNYGYGYSPYYGYGYGSYYGYGYSPYYSYGYAPYAYGYSSYAYAPWY
jgi:hypothetical protein